MKRTARPLTYFFHVVIKENTYKVKRSLFAKIDGSLFCASSKSNAEKHITLLIQSKKNKPLYKVLDSKRTQGEVSIDEQPLGTGKGFRIELITETAVIFHMVAHDYNLTKGHRKYTKENKATAQYTALAVNNLASLAEALDDVLQKLTTNKDATAEWRRNGGEEAVSKAKEALTKIS